MPDKMNLDYVKLRHCEFQKYKVMTMSVVGGQPGKHANTSYKATKHIECTSNLLFDSRNTFWNTQTL